MARATVRVLWCRPLNTEGHELEFRSSTLCIANHPTVAYRIKAARLLYSPQTIPILKMCIPNVQVALADDIVV